MYICKKCDGKFSNYKIINTTYEIFYGVSSDFRVNTPLKLCVCPYCNSEEINLIEEGDVIDYEL